MLGVAIIPVLVLFYYWNYTSSLKSKALNLELLLAPREDLVNGLVHSALAFLSLYLSRQFSLSQRTVQEVRGHWTFPRSGSKQRSGSIKNPRTIYKFPCHTKAMQRKSKMHLEEQPLSGTKEALARQQGHPLSAQRFSPTFISSNWQQFLKATAVILNKI